MDIEEKKQNTPQDRYQGLPDDGHVNFCRNHVRGALWMCAASLAPTDIFSTMYLPNVQSKNSTWLGYFGQLLDLSPKGMPTGIWNSPRTLVHSSKPTKR